MGALIGGGIATLLSLCILSRAIGDNPIYRFAQSLLVGTGLGYFSAVLLRNTLAGSVEAIAFGQATPTQFGVTIAGLIGGLLLLSRFGRQRASFVANLPLALVIGVGAAVALAGAVRGTLVPQILATARLDGLLQDVTAQVGTIVAAILTIVTLLLFSFTSRQSAAITGRRALWSRLVAQPVRGIGRFCMLLTFGVFFAAAITTYISALVGRTGDISQWASAAWTYLFGS
jgi:hypothetical protein